MPQVKIRHQFIHQAPRKLRTVTDQVRGLPVTRALAELQASAKSASQVVRKAILAAQAAASQQGLTGSQLFISQIMVNEGPRLRRFISLSRGRSQRINKQLSHLTVQVTDEPITIRSSKIYKAEQQKPAAKPAKTAKAAVAETPEGSSHGSES